MSGPPYPHPSPAPGSNSIGQFVIGVSPIGDIPPFDPWAPIIAQYANSPVLSQLCTNMAQYVDPTANMDAFFDTIFNVQTAVGYGLDVWGRHVGVSRVLQIPGGSSFFGFNEAGSWQGFGQAPFYSGGTSSGNFTLQDTPYRALILAKALANICDGSTPAINQLLLNLFPNRGNVYVTEGTLTMTYTFAFQLSQSELAIVQNSGVLPRTAGVSVTVVQL